MCNCLVIIVKNVLLKKRVFYYEVTFPFYVKAKQNKNQHFFKCAISQLLLSCFLLFLFNKPIGEFIEFLGIGNPDTLCIR